MEPVVLDFEGKKVELTGTAEKQYAQWRELLRRIYEAETGFASEMPDLSDSSKENGSK